MCKVLKVGRSGFYAWQRRPKSKRQLENEMLLDKIKNIHEKKRKIYGYPRITQVLRRDINIGKNRVHRIMKSNGLKSKTVKKRKICTTDSKHNLPVAENILNQNFNAENKCQKWVSDITYVPTGEGFLYVAGILDLYDRSIVGWAMETHMRKELVIEALNQAILRTNPSKGLLLHSDRGSQYCSNKYQEIIRNNCFVCSMSRKNNCWDNAPMESFWGKLKSEWLCDMKLKSISQAKAAVFEYIEIFYNRDRLHSSLGYITPIQKNKAS